VDGYLNTNDMKAQILKIAGVKSEKEFYRKFPTEEAFMKAHGKELKKAQLGTQMMGVGNMINQSFSKPISPNFINPQSMGGMQNLTGGMQNLFGSPGGAPNFNVPVPTPANAQSMTDQQLAGVYAKMSTPKQPKAGLTDALSKFAGPAGEIVGGIQQIRAEKEMLKGARQMEKVTDVALQASRSRPKRDAPRDTMASTKTGEELFPIHGVGTNPLAKNGAEISNTFAPNTLYSDLGYEKAAGGLEAFANMGGGDKLQGLGNAAFGQSGGSRIGGTIGGTIGSAFGPVGKMVGQVAGDLLGRTLDKTQQNIEKAQAASARNIQSMGFQNSVSGLQQGQYASVMEDGGRVSPYEWVSHTWQPQKIVSFGEHKMSDLLRPDRTMDTLRAGGHLKDYTPPSERAMSTERPEYAAGGALRTDWGGHLKPLSYNPFSDGDGMTYLGVGNSHEESDGKGRTGIGMTYGESKVEIEHGEPVQEMEDGGAIGEGEKSVLVSGNLMTIPILLGDESAKGKNFKTYVRDLSELENKATQKLQKATSRIGSMEMNSQFDKLKYNSLDATALGATMELKNYDERKKNAADLQTAMNDTMEEFGLKANDKGRIIAKDGIEIAQDGKKKPKSLEAIKIEKQTGRGNNMYGKATEADVAKLKERNPWYDWTGFNPHKKAHVRKFEEAYNKKAEEVGSASRLHLDEGLFGDQVASAKALYEESPTPASTPTPALVPEVPGFKPSYQVVRTTTPTTTAVPLQGPSIMDYLGAALPYLRPTDAEALDPNQLVGEMYALSNNQLEPVQAQGFQPELGVPYDISFQDRLNENQATFRSMQRMAGYNPAAQAASAAQKYGADQPVLAEQFRANQALRQGFYDKTRDVINQSRLTNLGIFDKQYERQATAQGLTKATALEALKSIGNKYLQKQLENRTLQTYENLYAYRFDPRFRAINMNAPAQWNMQGSGGSGGQGFGGGLDPNYEFTYNAQGRIIGTKKKSKSDDDDIARNGAIVKNLKSL
jgi:hypothetical protein